MNLKRNVSAKRERKTSLLAETLHCPLGLICVIVHFSCTIECKLLHSLCNKLQNGCKELHKECNNAKRQAGCFLGNWRLANKPSLRKTYLMVSVSGRRQLVFHREICPLPILLFSFCLLRCRKKLPRRVRLCLCLCSGSNRVFA